MPSTSPPPDLSIAVVEDDAPLRDMLCSAISATAGMQVAAQFAAVGPALQWLTGHPIDVLLTDLGLPDGSGIDLIRHCSALHPQCDIMVITMFGDEKNVLAAIEAGEIDKVVLSRGVKLALPKAIAPVTLLRRLTRQHPESTVFAVSNSHGIFLGATPEQLVGLADGQARADALAGTAWAGQPLSIDKNTHEQQLVVEAIRQAMEPLCASLHLPPAPQVLQLRDLQHLWTPVSGEVRPGIGLFDLLATDLKVPTSEGEMTLPAVRKQSQGKIHVSMGDQGGYEEILFRALRVPVVMVTLLPFESAVEIELSRIVKLFEPGSTVSPAGFTE